MESVIEYVNGLHERWQVAQKTWFGSSLVDMEHRLLLVEEAWKKLRHRSHRTVATTHHPLDVFRWGRNVVTHMLHCNQFFLNPQDSLPNISRCALITTQTMPLALSSLRMY